MSFTKEYMYTPMYTLGKKNIGETLYELLAVLIIYTGALYFSEFRDFSGAEMIVQWIGSFLA